VPAGPPPLPLRPPTPTLPQLWLPPIRVPLPVIQLLAPGSRPLLAPGSPSTAAGVQGSSFVDLLQRYAAARSYDVHCTGMCGWLDDDDGEFCVNAGCFQFCMIRGDE
jgi:hypothetical protein